MTEGRKFQNEELFNYLKSKKSTLPHTKNQRMHLIEKFKITKARANDIAKRV
jgi:hypothetical protein